MTRYAEVVLLTVFFLFTGQVARAQPKEDQYYRIRCVHSGLVLSVNGSKDDGAEIIQVKTGFGDDQQWKFVKVGDHYNVTNRLSGKALNVKGGSIEEGTPLIQWNASDNNAENQQWSLEKAGDTYALKARHSGLALDIAENSKEPNAKVIQWTYKKSDNQHFNLVIVENEVPKGMKIAHHRYKDHVESKKSGLEGEASYLAITDDKMFTKVFETFATMGGNFVPNNAFDSSIVLAVIKRGDLWWDYQVDQVTADKGTLYVQYSAKSKDGGGKTWSSELILAVKNGEYRRVVFFENGKTAGIAAIPK